MYLATASTIEDVIYHGIEPILELLHRFEDDIENLDYAFGRETAILYWTAKGNVLRIKEALERIDGLQGKRRAEIPISCLE